MVYSKKSVDVLSLSEHGYKQFWLLTEKMWPGVPITWDVFYLATNEVNSGAFTGVVKSQSGQNASYYHLECD